MNRVRVLTVLATVVVVAAGAILAASPALAIPITYTMTDTATGSLNGVGFTDESILLKMINDTTNITDGPGFFANNGTATVSVNGSAPVTFTHRYKSLRTKPLSPDRPFHLRMSREGLLYSVV